MATTKSVREAEDSIAAMGMGATNSLGRVSASLGLLNGVDPVFSTCVDVPNGGVLMALPGLLVSGLLSQTEKYFQLPKGYYRLDSIFLLLAFMALTRIKTIEDLRYCSPGEWGKLLGLDRIPEAKTLREKIGCLSSNYQPSRWSGQLGRQWMETNPPDGGLLYVDGHVRVYSGQQSKLPKHYVARQKLCLRATTDYWINAMDGQPFFMINKEVDPGLIKVLEDEIVPRLEDEIANQPTEDQLKADTRLHRFTLIFDREGYSPEFFLKMKNKRIACLTYHKFPGQNWPEEEFVAQKIKLGSGHVVEMDLAERGSFVGKKLWVREVRKLSDSGHQSSVISTDYYSDLRVIASAMFSRWSQENFFKYMRNHYNLDKLIEYATESIPDTIMVVNPDYRRLDTQVRKEVAILVRKQAKFGAMTMNDEIEPKNVEQYQQNKADLQEQINVLAKVVENLKARRKATKKHISINELPEGERFTRLSTQSKYLIDTIKMVAYRAETAMANVLRDIMNHPDEARSVLRAIYRTEADLQPNYEEKTLTVRLHQLANWSSTELIRHLCAELNATETVFPGTNLRLIYELVSDQNPRGQEV